MAGAGGGSGMVDIICAFGAATTFDVKESNGNFRNQQKKIQDFTRMESGIKEYNTILNITTTVHRQQQQQHIQHRETFSEIKKYEASKFGKRNVYVGIVTV